VAWTVETMRPLVERWDERVRGEVSRFRRLVPEAAAAASVLRAAADERQVAAAEDRLSLQLPPSYRSFLLISNGAYASTLGAEAVISGFESRHGFLAVESVAPAVEADADTVELWTGEPELNNPANDRVPASEKSVEVGYFQPIKDALLVSRPHETFRDMLVPRAGEVEWELWAFAKEGAIAHRSFADFLLAELGRVDRRPKQEHADKYVAEVREGKLYALERLAELADPRIGDIALEVLADESAPITLADYPPRVRERERVLRCAHVLGLLAEKRFIPTLRTAYANATTLEPQRATLDALVRCGAADAIDLLANAATNHADPAMREWAAWKLEQTRARRPE